MRTRHILAVLSVAACQQPSVGSTGFGSMPEVTAVGSASSFTSTGEGASSSSGSGTTLADDGSSVGDSVEMTSEPSRDLGVAPDFGDSAPVGCKGKIDFLFVISRQANMWARQAQIAVAVPQFIDTIKSKFDDFDYHIMVVDGDGASSGASWGNETCSEDCPSFTCKVGDPCCTIYNPEIVGQPCCDDPSYPCDDLDLVTTCDSAWGAGVVFPSGKYTADKPCPIDGGRRYLVKGQTDLEETFACIARVGRDGYGALGQALTAAMQKPINDPGGCNAAFLREDALLMVTFIAADPDVAGPLGSEGTTAEWAKAVVDAKHGDDTSVVIFNIGGCNCAPSEGVCHPADRLCLLTKMFPYHHEESVLVPDFGPAFVEAASLVETACAGFVPPG